MKLVRVRTLSQRSKFLFPLPLDPRFDEVIGKYATFRQKGVIVLQRIESLFQGAGCMAVASSSSGFIS